MSKQHKVTKHKSHLVSGPAVRSILAIAELGFDVDLWRLREVFDSSDYEPEANYTSLTLHHERINNPVSVTPKGKLIVSAPTKVEAYADLRIAADLVFSVIKPISISIKRLSRAPYPSPPKTDLKMPQDDNSGKTTAPRTAPITAPKTALRTAKGTAAGRQKDGSNYGTKDGSEKAVNAIKTPDGSGTAK